MAFMELIGPFIDKNSGQLSDDASTQDISSLMQDLTTVHDKTMCLMLIQRSPSVAPRLAEPLWPVLDIWLAEAKDSSNSTMLKQLLKVLSMLPVSFALLVGGRQIPKLVRKLAKKWPNGDVRVMAAELFAKYTALIEENTNGEATASAQQSSSSKSRVAAESDANKKFINSFTDGAEVEDWENEWKVYKALDDETPAQIAKKKKVSLIDLLKINVWRLEGLTPSSRLEEGTDILVPLDGPNDPKKAKKRMRPNISDEPPSRTNAKRVRSNSDSSAASAKRSSASSASASSATAPAKRPVAISPPARTPGSAKSGSAKSPTEPSQKKIVKQLVPQVRKLSSSGRSGSFGAALAKAKVVRAPPKKIVQPTKMAKPTIGKTKVTQSVVSVTTSKQAQSKPASGSSKTVARSELSKTTIKKPNVKSGSPVQSSTKSVNGSAVAAHSAEKGPAPAPKKIAATSSGGSKTSKSGPPRRRVHFPGQGDTKVYPGESDSKPLDASKLVKIKFIPTRANIAVFSPVRSAEHQREQAHNEFQRAQQQAMYLQKERQPRPQMAWSTPVPIDLKSIELVFNRWDCAVRRKHPAYSGLIDSLDSLKEAVMNGVERRGETLKAHPCRCGEQALREQSIAPFVLKPDARLPDNPTEPDTRRDRGELVDPYYIVPVIPLNDVSPKLVESVPASAPGPALVGPEMDLFSNTAVLDQLIADASNAGPIVEPASTYQQHGTAPVYAQSAGGYSYDNPAPVQDRYDRGRNGSGAAGLRARK
eukprot:gene12728-17539_t